jgi:hypothetical protein
MLRAVIICSFDSVVYRYDILLFCFFGILTVYNMLLSDAWLPSQ